MNGHFELTIEITTNEAKDTRVFNFYGYDNYQKSVETFLQGVRENVLPKIYGNPFISGWTLIAM